MLPRWAAAQIQSTFEVKEVISCGEKNTFSVLSGRNKYFTALTGCGKKNLKDHSFEFLPQPVQAANSTSVMETSECF